jgi:hypothetical protein
MIRKHFWLKLPDRAHRRFAGSRKVAGCIVEILLGLFVAGF